MSSVVNVSRHREGRRNLNMYICVDRLYLPVNEDFVWLISIESFLYSAPQPNIKINNVEYT